MRCKVDLIRTLLCTRDYAKWNVIDDDVRYMYALTDSFAEWVGTGRRVDSLAHQMRIWVRRDIVPLVEATHAFTRPVPIEAYERNAQYLDALRLMNVLSLSARSCPAMTVDAERFARDMEYRARLVHDGGVRWHDARRRNEASLSPRRSDHLFY